MLQGNLIATTALLGREAPTTRCFRQTATPENLPHRRGLSTGTGKRNASDRQHKKVQVPTLDNVLVTAFVRFLNALLIILFVTGYLALIVVASIISNGPNPAFGQTIAVTVLVMGAILGIGLLVVGYKQKHDSHAVAAGARPLIFSAHESQAFEDDAETVWALIRPAESAVLLGNAQRAFTVPGTPYGVGEQQCFIGGHGAVSIIELVGEESPRWATTKTVTLAEPEVRQTYQIESSASGCSLRVGTALEAHATHEWIASYEAAWRAHIRQYLARVEQVLAMQRKS